MKQFQQVHVHLVYATANRVPVLTREVCDWLWPALAESARSVGCNYVVVGGVADHVHVLVALPMAVAVAEVIRRLKGASSRLLHLRGLAEFAWQEGYGAFSASRDHLAIVEAYVRNQPTHHLDNTTQNHLETHD